MNRQTLILSVLLALPAGLACKKKPTETGGGEAVLTDANSTKQNVPAEVQEMARNFSRVFFDFDKSELTAETKAALDSNVAIMQAKADIKVEIQGHADERGTTDYNLALGTRRAQTVLSYMSTQGVAPSRLKVVSYGEERPLASGSSETAWGQNRRAEFRITWGEAADVSGTVQ